MESHCFLVCLLLLLQTCSSSSQETSRSLTIDVANDTHPSPPQKQMNWKLLYEIKVHGFLLWASMGLLMPIGIISMRMSNKDQCGTTHLRRLFYLHVSSQMLGVILATVAAIMSIRNFNNSFNNYHQRIGVGLYVAIWFQTLLGFLRPSRGHRARTPWFVAHWFLGTSLSLLGVINIYTGLHAYTTKTSRSVNPWNILFTVQVSCMAFFYLFQDKWSYIRDQSSTSSLPDKPTNLSDQNNVSTTGDEFRDIATVSSDKC